MSLRAHAGHPAKGSQGAGEFVVCSLAFRLLFLLGVGRGGGGQSFLF